MKQITFPDSRFYQVDSDFYPSVTSILTYWPKPPAFYKWLKDVGRNADIIMREAGQEGTKTHQIVEDLLTFKEIQYTGPKSSSAYLSAHKFSQFWDQAKPKLLHTEVGAKHDTYQYAGTVDLIVKVKDEIWLLDIKSSNNIHESYYGQLMAYKKAIEDDEETYKHITKIDKVGILWLSAKTRSISKKPDIYQGEGWKLLFVENEELYWQGFLNAYFFYKMYNPEPKPKVLTLPETLKLKKYD